MNSLEFLRQRNVASKNWRGLSLSPTILPPQESNQKTISGRLLRLLSFNAATLHTRNNPDFFKGTVVEQAVTDELGLKTPLPTAGA